MDIAIPNLPFGAIIEKALSSSFGPRTNIHRGDSHANAEALVAGHVDVALIPTVTALRNSALFDVFPGFAVSSWGYPYARLVLPGGLAAIDTVLHVPASNAQEGFIASVVLQEHYGTRVSVVVEEGAAPLDRQQVVVGEAMFSMEALDLGQEWYELVNYPMVWGVFATLKGNSNHHMIRGISDAAAIAERLRQDASATDDDALSEFIGADLRFRFDDLATASITELTQYLFYYQGNDEIDELPLVHLPDDEADAEELPQV